MTYTAEQLRRDAIAIERMHGDTLTVEWRGHQASQLRAHADALEENARLKAAWDASHKQAMKNGAACNEWRDRANRAEAGLATLREQLAKRDAELAAIKVHAEAMAEGIESSHLEIEQEALAAYRADFTEEK